MKEPKHIGECLEELVAAMGRHPAGKVPGTPVAMTPLIEPPVTPRRKRLRLVPRRDADV